MNEEEQPEQEQVRGEREPKVSPKIWVASLSDYNAGDLHGAWVDADREPDAIWKEIDHVLRSSRQPGAEEWAVFDQEGFCSFRLSENESVERISQLGRGIARHGEPFAAFAVWAVRRHDEDLLEQFEECYLGHWESLRHFADILLEEMGWIDLLEATVPECFRRYVKFDVREWATDAWASGKLYEIEDSEGTGVFLFRRP